SPLHGWAITDLRHHGVRSVGPCADASGGRALQRTAATISRTAEPYPCSRQRASRRRGSGNWVRRPSHLRPGNDGTAAARPRPDAGRKRVFEPPWNPRALAISPGASLHLSSGRTGIPGLLRPSRFGQRNVRGQLELARADLDAGERTADSGIAPFLLLLWRGVPSRVPDRLWPDDEPLRGGERNRRAPDADLPARPARSSAGVRRHGEVPGRPALAGSDPLLRVLPPCHPPPPS